MSVDFLKNQRLTFHVPTPTLRTAGLKCDVCADLTNQIKQNAFLQYKYSSGI